MTDRRFPQEEGRDEEPEREIDVSPMNWIRDVRVGYGTVVGILLVLVGLWALFSYTDLWYVLFP